MASESKTDDKSVKSKDDELKLSKNDKVLKMLSKLGDNFPSPEKIVLSTLVTKINKRSKHQSRIILLTDKAFYNLDNKNYSCKRRIDIEKIVSVTLSSTSNEFAIHVPEEYDYRYKSINKKHIINVLSKLYQIKEGKKLALSTIQQDSMMAIVITKDVAKLQTREQRLERYRELLAKSNYDDEINDIKNKVTGHLIKTKDKVKPDDFEFLKVIGRGSFGKVMQVRKKGTGEIFAMKILKKKSLIQKNQVEHTNAERKILQSLQHPFLMKLRYAFQTEAKLYFVLDYYRGGELFFHLKRKRRFNEEQAKLFVIEVALALGHLHSLDIVYRDLKPENILLDHSGHICLTDFGLSKDLGTDENNKAHTFCGTPEYLAPEIVANVGHNKAVDWWSLGILLYELTVGIPPFYSQNVNEMYKKIKDAPLLFPPTISEYCKDLVTKLLDRNPKTRMGSSKDDVKEIIQHPFFKNINIKKLMKKEIKPTYIPNVKGVDDTSQFDKTFLNEKVCDTFAAKPNLQGGTDGFDGFTFIPKKTL